MQVKKERRVEPFTWLRCLSGPGAGGVLAAGSVQEAEQWHFTWGGESASPNRDLGDTPSRSGSLEC